MEFEWLGQGYHTTKLSAQLMFENLVNSHKGNWYCSLVKRQREFLIDTPRIILV